MFDGFIAYLMTALVTRIFRQLAPLPTMNPFMPEIGTSAFLTISLINSTFTDRFDFHE
jgi:hypothetical protein